MESIEKTEKLDHRHYIALLNNVKKRVDLAQQRLAATANEEMLRMYWDIGEMLHASQKSDGWGNKTLQRLSTDIKNEYSDVKGFSVRNLQCMIQFYLEYEKNLTSTKSKKAIAQSVTAQLPTLPVKHLSWTHNILLIQKVKDINARYWYMTQCLKSHWNVRYLSEAISLNRYGSIGALANNFDETMPSIDATRTKALLKDPYIFDMLTFSDQYNERDVEIGLVKHIDQFLVEMGAGFAFMGRQYHICVSGDDYYIDILMYNTFIHRYLVIELKASEFKPEYVGKLNFYCSAIDDLLCRDGDNPTIGLLLCKTKDNIKAEYALRGLHKPIGISDYELGQTLPVDFRGKLPSIEELESEFQDFK